VHSSRAAPTLNPRPLIRAKPYAWLLNRASLNNVSE